MHECQVCEGYQVPLDVLRYQGHHLEESLVQNALQRCYHVSLVVSHVVRQVQVHGSDSLPVRCRIQHFPVYRGGDHLREPKESNLDS
jgi:hypothetical protein